MAIKVNGVTVIDDDRKGIFNKVSAGNYTTAEREALGSLSEGELVYDTTAKKLFIYDGAAWADVGGGGGNGLVSSLPPFASQAETDTYLHSDDGKIQFSLDDITYTDTLTVPRGQIYYVNWGTDIRSASHGSSYSAGIGVTFTNIGPGVGGTTRSIDYEISSIDKVPNFNVGFTSLTDINGDQEYESDIVSPFETINAPAQIWVTSDASSFKLRVGLGTWFDPPTIPSTTYINRNEEIQVKHTTGTSPLTEYTTTVNVGYGAGVGEFDSIDFITTTQNSIVSTPSITSPADGNNVDTEVLTLTGSSFDGTNAGSHASTHWQIASDSSFTTIVEETDSGSNLTSWSPSFGLSYTDSLAYARVRYRGSINNITSDWSSTITFTPQQWFLWRVSVSIGGGKGGNGNGGTGGNGGSGSFTMQTGSTYSYDPPGSVSGSIASNGSGRTGGGGYGSGGTASQCTDGSGGGGGGSTAFRYNGSVMAVVGGGGGGGRVGGGGGGGINQDGAGGGVYGDVPAGSGGSTSTSSGGGSSGGCGFHSGNPDRRFSGGAGGGGGGGGGNSGGNTQNSWEGGSGGGGGGGGWTTSPISGSDWTVTSGPSATQGGSGSGSYSVQLSSAPHSNPSQFTNRSSNTNGNSITLASLK